MGVASAVIYGVQPQYRALLHFGVVASVAFNSSAVNGRFYCPGAR